MELVNRPEPASSRGRSLFLWGFSIAMVATAGTAFLFKLIEFYLTATGEGSQALASFLIPVANYLLVAGGFLCLFVWAFLTGQFKNVEQTKVRMLEMQEEIDRQEARLRAARSLENATPHTGGKR